MYKNILSIDIGGTNSRFAHFVLEGEELKLCANHICKTTNIHNTEQALDIAKKYALSPHDAHLQIWGVAGLIAENGLKASLTNTNLSLDFTSFTSQKDSKQFFLLNDFALQAWACLAHNLKGHTIFTGKPYLNATKGILGAGTGLGTAAIIPTIKKSWVVMQSEGGHVELPLKTKQEHDFANFVSKELKQDYISAEHILAGNSLSLLHKYMYGTSASPQEVSALWAKNPNCQALNLYAGFLGRFCKQWALNTLCLGGLYLCGGVLVKNKEIFNNKNFINEFYANPKAMPITHQIPLHLITHEHASLWGGAYAAKSILTHP